MPTPPKVGCFVTVIGRYTFFYLDCDRTSTFALKGNVDVLSQVTGDPSGSLPACFTGGGQNVTMVKITRQKTAKSRRSFQTSGRSPCWNRYSTGVCTLCTLLHALEMYSRLLTPPSCIHSCVYVIND
jgi:hypothetical protein